MTFRFRVCSTQSSILPQRSADPLDTLRAAYRRTIYNAHDNSEQGDAMSEVGRRLVSAGGGRMELEAFEVGDPGPGEVLVRVHRSP